MRIALRIFLAHVLLSLLLATATLLAAQWTIGRLVEGVADEAASELGRELGLFLTSTGGANFDEYNEAESEQLQKWLAAYRERSAPVESILLVDDAGRIRFASDPAVVGMVFNDEDERAILLSDEPTIRDVPRAAGDHLREITVPIRSLGDKRLGSLRFQLIPPYYAEFLEQPRRSALWLIVALVAFIASGGIVVASILTIPVRRLNRMMLRLQHAASGDAVEFDDRSEFAPALRVVRGMRERLDRLAESTRSNELLLATMTRALEQGVLSTDTAGSVVAVNQAALRLLGWGPAAEHTEEATLRLRGDSQLWRIATDLDGDGVRTVDLPGRREGSGGIRVSSYILRDEGKTAGVMLLLRDLDSVKALEQHLQEAGRLSLLVRLTSTMAHEIKNPLNSIVINVEALRSILSGLERERLEECEPYLEVIVREIYHLDQVMREYLDLAAGGERQPSSVKVPEVVEDVVELLRFEAHESRVRVVCEVEDDLPTVPLAAVRLKQALLNLGLNAIQAMEPGGCLTVRARKDGTGTCIDVADTGPGIPEAIRKSVFNFHFTTKAEGSGLGLPITRMIVESAGGTLELDSTAGDGTTFHLRFPGIREAAARWA